MAEVKRRKKTDGPRTEVFAMRLDPKLKYLAEIAARKQRRSLANFIEWTIEQALGQVNLEEGGFNDRGITVAEMSAKLWALDESDRLVQLANLYPDLLTYEEQLIWRVITEHSAYNEQTKRMSSFKSGATVDVRLVRDCWTEIKAFGLGTGTEEALDESLCLHDDIPF
jgi:hypothetical protein